jgi:hypothetical protein
MYAKNCLILLTIFLSLITCRNAQYFAHGYFLHLLPMLVLCGVAWATLREGTPPKTTRMFWILVVTAVASFAMELFFQIYKRKPFDEHGVVTILSFTQLLLTCFVSFDIWRQRRKAGPLRLKDDSTIWLIIALGFAYLAADEEILLHEGAGHSFHKLLGLAETAWSSRLDDMLVGVYGVIGIIVLWLYRREICRFPLCLRLLKVGFVALLFSVVADGLSHRPDLFVSLLGREQGMLFYELGESADEIFKIIGEIFFLTGLSSGLLHAKMDAASQRTAAQA